MQPLFTERFNFINGGEPVDILDSTLKALSGHFVSLVFILLPVLWIMTALLARTTMHTESSDGKSLFPHYKQFWLATSNHIRNFFRIGQSHFPLFNLLLGSVALLNFCLLMLFPLSVRPPGLRSDYGIPFILATLLLNVIVYATCLFYTPEDRADTILRLVRQLSTVIITIITGLLSVCLVNRTFDVELILSEQQTLFAGVLPTWNVLRHPMLFGNALFIFGGYIVMLQLLNQTASNVPNKTDPPHPRSRSSIGDSYIQLWSRSLMLLIGFSYVYFFWGGQFLLPGIGGMWIGLLIKISLLLFLSNWLYHVIPQLIEEQLIRIAYTIIIPVQVIAMVITVLVYNP